MLENDAGIQHNEAAVRVIRNNQNQNDDVNHHKFCINGKLAGKLLSSAFQLTICLSSSSNKYLNNQ